jgi:hypothetical protein
MSQEHWLKKSADELSTSQAIGMNTDLEVTQMFNMREIKEQQK